MLALLLLAAWRSIEIPALGTQLDARPAPGSTLVGQRGDAAPSKLAAILTALAFVARSLLMLLSSRRYMQWADAGQDAGCTLTG